MEGNEVQFIEFREELYKTFNNRADATTDLIDALCGNQSATSPVQLSLSPLFRRQYASLHDAVDNFSMKGNIRTDRSEQLTKLTRVTASLISRPVARNFYLFATDATSQPRQSAKTLSDQGFVYQPNPIKGCKPVTIGHSYSALAGLPEKKGEMTPPWVVPISLLRVPTDEKANDIAASQIDAQLNDATLPFGKALSVVVGDTAYSAITFLSQAAEHENLVAVVRVRGDRTFYRKPQAAGHQKGKGHPTWFGDKSVLGDDNTYGTPDETVSETFTNRRGKVCTATIMAWRELMMRGKKNIPMHKHPFTVLCVTLNDAEGNMVCRRPMQLAIFGKRRDEISVKDAYYAYRQRFDIEHFFRFGKNRLLMDSFQTPETEHEENWWIIAALAYAQLLAASEIAIPSCHPWERYLPNFERNSVIPTPSMVQRDMARIISESGTPAKAPEPRGKSPGRLKGECPGRRERFPVIKKGDQVPKRASPDP